MDDGGMASSLQHSILHSAFCILHFSSALSFCPRMPKTYYDLVREAKTRVKEVTAAETIQILNANPGTVIVDCREPNEAALGTVAGAVVVPRGIMEQNIERVAKRDQKVIIYCAGGNRSALAADTLREMGYSDVATMAGGFRAWIDAGGEVDG
jgi:sulfur-carrier protein adenylyltransferase/sulfurtransferase